MPEIRNDGVRISYDVAGEGSARSVLLLGWCCDRSWWTEPGYVEELRRDHLLVVVDLRGHGTSDKPHEAAAYTANALTGDVFADAEGLDRFAIWGQFYGGWIAWMTATAALNGSRRWCPRDRGTRDPFTKSRRRPTSGMWPSGTVGRAALVDLFKNEDGAAARAAVQQARGFPTLATPGPALIA